MTTTTTPLTSVDPTAAVGLAQAALLGAATNPTARASFFSLFKLDPSSEDYWTVNNGSADTISWVFQQIDKNCAPLKPRDGDAVPVEWVKRCLLGVIHRVAMSTFAAAFALYKGLMGITLLGSAIRHRFAGDTTAVGTSTRGKIAATACFQDAMKNFVYMAVNVVISHFPTPIVLLHTLSPVTYREFDRKLDDLIERVLHGAAGEIANEVHSTLDAVEELRAQQARRNARAQEDVRVVDVSGAVDAAAQRVEPRVNDLTPEQAATVLDAMRTPVASPVAN